MPRPGGRWLALFLDTSEVLRVMLLLWMWTMPIVDPKSLVPPHLLDWFELTPPTRTSELIANLGLGTGRVDVADWATMIAWVIISTTIGLATAARLRPQVLDVA